MSGATPTPVSSAPLWLFGLVLALALLPVFVAGPIPAMVDYPNHLARMAVLARAGTAAANPFYRTAWALYPNLAMDALVPPLARLIGVETAMRSFLVASQLLIVGGAVAVERAVKRRFGFAGHVAAVSLYCDPFAWGFVNFEFGLGLALLAFAAWIAARERRAAGRLAFHALACVVLFLSHLFALGVYGWAVGLYELWRWRTDRRRLNTLAATALGLVWPVIALAALTAALGGGVGGTGAAWSLPAKGLWLLSLNGYSWRLSFLLSLAVLVVVYALARQGRLRLIGAGPMLALGFAVLFLVMPHRLLDTEYVDVRVVVAAALILPGFMVADLRPLRRTGLLLGVLWAVAVADLVQVAWMQANYRREYAALTASFTALPPQARVLVGRSGEVIDPPTDLSEYPMFHAPVLAVMYADAFVPTLFSYPGKQPVLPRPEVRPLSLPQGGPVSLSMLLAAAKGRGASGPSYIADWTQDFDAVYLIGPPIQNPLPGVLTPTASGRRFVLYRTPRRLRAPAGSLRSR